MNKVLIVGGAGYIGTILIGYLLKKKYNVTCLDNFIYNHKKSIQEFKKKKKFDLINSDLRNKNIKSLIDKADYIVILAGLVGDPITKKYKKLAKSINDVGIKKLIKVSMNSNLKKMVFVSTCSNYGVKKTNKLAKENHSLNPKSLYANSKVSNEKYILSFKKKSNVEPIILRFATAFGLSNRMRFDLTVNEFVKDLLLKKKVSVYDPDTWRPYCHVLDFARAIEKVISFKKSLSFEIFNIGTNKNNFTKRQIVNKILKHKIIADVIYLKKSSDKRNYKVNFSKVKKILKFNPKYSVDFGIKEIKKYLINSKNIKKNKFDKLGNYYIKNNG